jgi:hypothetical protein
MNKDLAILAEHESTSTWDLLPADLMAYLIARTNLPTLFSMRLVSKGSCDAVQHCLKNIISATSLLRSLHFYQRHESEVGCRIDLSEGYRNARSQILKFQKLAKLLNLGDRWQNFNTVEGGVLALMTVPLAQLNADKVRCLAYGGERVIQAECVKAEITRLGEGRVNEIVKRLEGFEKKLQQDYVVHNYEYLKVRALMILRVTDDSEIQDFLIKVDYVPRKDIASLLLGLWYYAKKTNKSRAIEVLEWLIETDRDDCEKTLEKMILENDTSMIMQRSTAILFKLRAMLAQAGYWEEPVSLMEISSKFWECLYNDNHGYETDYTLSTCVLLFGWERGFDLYLTVRSHANTLLSISKMVSGKLRTSYPFSTGPSFTNYSGLKASGNELYSNLFGSNFGEEWGSSNSHFYGNWMDKAILSGHRFSNSSFKKMKITGMISKAACFDRCQFEDLALEDVQFDGTLFGASRFRDCDLLSSVSFAECRFDFESIEKVPVIFDRCKLDARSLIRARGLDKLRLINCNISNIDQLPTGITSYVTDNTDTNTLAGLYELFMSCEKSSDYSMVDRLQVDLLEMLSGIPKGSRVIPSEQDSQIREVAGYQIYPSDRFLSMISMGWIDRGRFWLGVYERLRFRVDNNSEPVSLSIQKTVPGNDWQGFFF